MYEYEKKEVILKVENVSLNLGGTQILKDVNFEIQDIVRPGMTQGQIISLVAPSGMGKTKMFELLAGIIPLNHKGASGKILIGKNLEPVKIGNVGVVQQNYPLFEHRTIYGNLSISANVKYKNKKEKDERVKDMLDRFGLYEKKDYYPSQLSGGQRQRIAISSQILCSNNFLILDEPYSGLDVLMIKKVSKLIIDISKMDELNTIIIASHDIASTSAISDSVLIMGRDYDSDGKPIQGTKIKHQYDLAKMGLAWDEGIDDKVEFNNLVKEIKNSFNFL